MQRLEAIVSKSVLRMGSTGTQDRVVVGLEAAAAINSRLGVSGINPHLLLFRQKLKPYVELHTNDKNSTRTS